MVRRSLHGFGPSARHYLWLIVQVPAAPVGVPQVPLPDTGVSWPEKVALPAADPCVKLEEPGALTVPEIVKVLPVLFKQLPEIAPDGRIVTAEQVPLYEPV